MNPRRDVDPHGGHGSANEPTPTIWPVGFAVGIACIFVGLIISQIVLVVGAVLTALFGFLWIRDATSGLRTPSSRRTRDLSRPRAHRRSGRTAADPRCPSPARAR